MMIITLDGPAGTGKTTVAKQVANQLQLPYIDTGAMYRAVTWFFLEKKVPLDQAHDVLQALKEFHFEIKKNQEEASYFVGSVDVTEIIRSPTVTAFVSKVSALQQVRDVLWQMQKKIAQQTGGVFEGRDLGSVVFPDADYKFYLTASAEIRAKRRWEEYQNAGLTGPHLETYEDILEQINLRDQLDSSRPIAPLKKPVNSYEIDTSHLSIPEVVSVITRLCHSNPKDEDQPKKASLLYRLIIFLTRSFFRLFYDLHVHGLDRNYPDTVILAANHASYFDPPVVAAAWKRPVHFLAKASLFKNRLFAALIRQLNAHPIASQGKHLETVRKTVSLLAEGYDILIFPEGTRSASEQLSPLKNGAAHLACQSNVACVPVYIAGTYKAWNRYMKWPRLKGQLHVVFGEPIFPCAVAWEDKKMQQKHITDQIESSINQLKIWLEEKEKSF